MKKTIAYLILGGLVFAGCKKSIVEVDHIAPFAPRGIYTETGDDVIRLSWLANSEPDVAGYKVYFSDAYDGVYEMIGQTNGVTFSDYGAGNGVTVYYAVTAFDYSGNESDLSHEVVYDTPRPEGFGVALPDFRIDPNRAGYDFSTYTVGPYDDQYTDIYFEYFNGTYYLDVWEDTEIQDMGYTGSLGEIGYAPTAGWSPTKDVRLIAGHTYVVRTWNNHYAKVRIRSLSTTQVVFDWAYQLQQGNTRLKQQAERGKLTAGTGVLSRGG